MQQTEFAACYTRTQAALSEFGSTYSSSVFQLVLLRHPRAGQLGVKRTSQLLQAQQHAHKNHNMVQDSERAEQSLFALCSTRLLSMQIPLLYSSSTRSSSSRERLW